MYDKILTASLAALLLAGCNTSIKAEPKKPVALVPLSVQAATLSPVATVSLERANPQKMPSQRQLALTDDGVLAVTRSGVLSAIVQGQLLWQKNLGEAVVGGVGYDPISQSAIVSTRSGTVLALDGKSGELRWRQTLGATVLSPATIAGNRALLSANNGVIYGLNLQTGELVWQFASQNPTTSSHGSAKALRLDGDTAVFGAADGRIYALSADAGTLLWTRRVGASRLGDVDATPLVVANRLYVSSVSGQLSGFDMATGQTLFSTSGFATSLPLVHLGGTLIGADRDGMVYGFDMTSGKRLWQNNALRYRTPSAPVVIGRFVAFGDYDGVVHLFDGKGDLVARTQTKGQIHSLQAKDGRLYAQTEAGQVAIWQVQ